MEDSAFKVCPFCKEQIRREAIKCRFCGEWLESSEPDLARKLTTDKPIVPPLTPPQKANEPSSMKAVGRALDETYLQQRSANPPIPDVQNKTTRKASAKAGARTKSITRLIVGVFLIGGAANAMRNMPSAHLGHDPVEVTTYLGLVLLLASVGVWMVVSYLRKR